jgi:hypothetical protein
MGLMNKMRNVTGATPEELLQQGPRGEQSPSATIARPSDPSNWSAARILELGTPCQAVIVETQPLGMRNPKGEDLYAFVLTVIAEGRLPYAIQIGNPVPAAALPLLHPGNTVPARRLPDGDDRELVIDWGAALTDSATTAA